MGRTARDSSKTSPPVRFRLTDELFDAVNEAWKNSSMRDIDRQNFLIYLIREGLKRHNEIEKTYQSHLMAAESKVDYKIG